MRSSRRALVWKVSVHSPGRIGIEAEREVPVAPEADAVERRRPDDLQRHVSLSDERLLNLGVRVRRPAIRLRARELPRDRLPPDRHELEAAPRDRLTAHGDDAGGGREPLHAQPREVADQELLRHPEIAVGQRVPDADVGRVRVEDRATVSVEGRLFRQHRRVSFQSQRLRGIVEGRCRGLPGHRVLELHAEHAREGRSRVRRKAVGQVVTAGVLEDLVRAERVGNPRHAVVPRHGGQARVRAIPVDSVEHRGLDGIHRPRAGRGIGILDRPRERRRHDREERPALHRGGGAPRAGGREEYGKDARRAC